MAAPLDPRTCRRVVRGTAGARAESLEQRLALSAGELDPSFGVGGAVFPSGFTVPIFGDAGAVAFTGDGKLVVAGDVTNAGGLMVARFKADGTPDPTFDGDGKAVVAGGFNVTAAAVQADGKVVVAGNSGGTVTLARLNPNGSVDTTFNGTGRVQLPTAESNAALRALAILPDGKIVAAGGTNYFWAARVNAGGTPDTTFNGNGVQVVNITSSAFGTEYEDHGEALAVQADGKLLVAGTASYLRATVHGAVLRLNADGSRDMTFGGGDGIADVNVPPSGRAALFAVAALADGRISVAGSGAAGFLIGRLSPDGSPDASFGTGGYLSTPFNSSVGFGQMTFTAGGKVVVAGNNAGSPNELEPLTVRRYNPDATLDTTFGTAGTTETPVVDRRVAAGDLAVSPTGEVAVAVQSVTQPSGGSNWPLIAARYLPDGQPDVAFGGGVVQASFRNPADPSLVAIDEAPGGKLVVAGTLGDDIVVGRYNHDGSPDTSFDGDGWLTVGETGWHYAAHEVEVLPDGKVLVVGTAWFSFDQLLLLRFNADGSPDTTFGTNGKVKRVLGDLATHSVDLSVQADGKILAGGQFFSSAPARSYFFAARYLPDGTPDTTFGAFGLGVAQALAPAGFSLNATALVPLSDGAIAVGGAASPSTPTPSQWAVARFGPDGMPDSSFGAGGVRVSSPGGSGGFINDLAAGPDGSIVATGWYYLPNPAGTGFVGQTGVVRMLPSGDLDAGFGDAGIATLAGGMPRLVRLPDGKILAGGAATGPGGTVDVSFTRLNSDGTVDTSFGAGGRTWARVGGQSNVLSDFSLLSDGALAAVGTGPYPDGKPFVARFLGAPAGVTVAGRHLFYNHSVFDGHDPAATPADVLAVATDKAALLPGQVASFANVSGYSRGINGVLIDFAGMPPVAALRADDFEVRTGSGGDPGAWAVGPAPASVVQLATPFGGNSSRYALTWADGAARNTWIQVTIKAGARTGLAAPDVFYFGSLGGDVTDDAGALTVGAADVAAVRRAMFSGGQASITNAADLNRDGRVNALDLALVRASFGRTLAPLSAPAVAGEAPAFSSFPADRRTPHRAAYEIL